MSKARQLADLLDSNGDVVVGALDNAPDPDLTPYVQSTALFDEGGDVKADLLDNVPPSNDASALTTGTLPIARIADGAVTAAKIGSLPAGSVLQVKSAGYSSGDATSETTVSSSGTIDLMVITMTVQANSKVMMWFDSHQTSLDGINVNPDVYFDIDGSDVDTGTNHYFYQSGGRTVIHKIFLSDALTAGSHTFKVIGEAYNGNVTYNYQNNNSGVFMIQEIAG